jgi:hypothetical protein
MPFRIATSKFLFVQIFLIFYFINSSFLAGQTVGSNRSDIEWKILESPIINVIYTKGYEDKANRVANIINYLNENNTRSVGPKSRKIDILLRPETVEPNGYVGLAPFRSEFFTTPPSDLGLLGTLDWMDQLAIHENRHIQQYNNSLHGVTKFGYFLGGQFFWTGLANLSIPNWYYEGDAVIAETALTNSGRGRTPNFLKEMKVLALENKNYSYMKWRNGSFTDRVPNAYPLGYMMLTHARNNFGNDISAEVLKSGSAYEKILYPFSQAMKSKTKFTTTALFNDAWKTYSDQWQQEANKEFLTPKTILSKNNNTVTDYKYPQYGNKDLIYTVKSSYKSTDEIISLNKGFEKKIVTIGLNNDNYFHHNNNRFVWTEFSFHPRRNNLNYNDIFLYDLNNKKKEKITQNGRYFSPIISKDGMTIIAIFIDKEQNSSLIQIDVLTKKESIIITMEPDANLFRPTFLENENRVGFIKKYKSKLSINKIDLDRKEVVQLTTPSAHLIDNLSYSNDFIYYNSSYNGMDNIYRCSISEVDKIQQISSVASAANSPHVSEEGDKLIFADHTFKGFQIAQLDLNDGRSLQNISTTEPDGMQWMDKVAAQAEGGNILEKIPTVAYKSKRYNGLFKGLKLHSWTPFPSITEPGLELQVNNILDDASMSLGGSYNVNEKGMKFLAGARLAKYFPVFDLQVSRQDRNARFLTTADTFNFQKFNEFSAGASVFIPLFWAKVNYIKSFEVRLGLDQKLLTNKNDANLEFKDLNRTISRFAIFYSNKRITALQNMRSRFGFDAIATYQRSLDVFEDEKLFTSSNIFLPGLLPNHSLKITGSYQRELLTNVIQLSDAFQYARGYNFPTNDQAIGLGFNYAFPLLYPDFGLRGLTYFKRVKMNLFYDLGNYKIFRTNRNFNLSSIGTELVFDNVWLNVLPISLGVRYNYRLNNFLNQKEGGGFNFFVVNRF